MARKSRAKKEIQAMMPQKEWLNEDEAMAYTNYSINELKDLVVKNNLSVSKPSPHKTYYNVQEINDRIFKRNCIVKATA